MKKELIFLPLAALLGWLILSFLPSSSPDHLLNNSLSFPSPYVSTSGHYPKCSDHDPSNWHAAIQKDQQGNILCAYGHEHGDKPPGWVTDSGIYTGFDHSSGFMANTSDYENSQKHSAMKGFSANIKGVEVYARIHLASNVLDRSARYHSYELYVKDQSANISHFQGWLDSGDPVKDRIPYRDSTAGEKSKDPGIRPIVWAATKHACQVDQTWCVELWSMKSWNWGPDIIWGINDATTFFQEGEENTADTNKWNKSGSSGTDRSITVTIYRKPEDLKKRGVIQPPVGKIWATQFGEIVSGPEDPICHQNTIKYNLEYQNICLENYIASTLPQITGVGNTAQKEFDSRGIDLPN